MGFPCFGGKDTIVSMIMLDVVTHACSIAFKELFSFNGFFGRRGLLKVYKGKIGSMVDKDSDNFVP